MNHYFLAKNLTTTAVRTLMFLSVLFTSITHAKADALDIGEFTLGIFSSIAVHELGHAAAVEATGGNVKKSGSGLTFTHLRSLCLGKSGKWAFII
jgi:hypothetical protein